MAPACTTLVSKYLDCAEYMFYDQCNSCPLHELRLQTGDFRIMENNKVVINSIDEYIATFPEETQKILKELRATIKAAAPDATEIISYGMPCFAQKGNLVYFSVAKNHIGFYPTPSAIKEFKDELSNYEGAKGSVQFPKNKPLPLEFISKIVKFRVAENLKKAEIKSGKRK
jgi:uncharacterized protein YdhG (YjbR/CyaY superfamily)